MTDWRKVWQSVQANPLQSVAFRLLTLNGLTVEQIAHLTEASFTDAFIRTHDGHTVPLVVPLPPELLGATGELFTPALDALRPLETEAHRRLSGALWVTNEETRWLLETTAAPSAPILPLSVLFPFSISAKLDPATQPDMAHAAHATLQTAADWLMAELQPAPSLLTRIIGALRHGSLLFVLVSTGVSGLNLVHNVWMGRLLSPAEYGQLTLFITLQLLLGLGTNTLQTTTSRFGARYSAQAETAHFAALRYTLRRLAVALGLAGAILLFVLAPVLADVFQLREAALLWPLALVLPVFYVLGVDRGLVQAVNGYGWLSAAYALEGVARLGLSVVLGYALLNVGRALDGAVWGVAQSLAVTGFITWLAVRHIPHAPPAPPSPDERAQWATLARATLFALIGQALITNSDFLLVKNFFSADEAGLYAAISVLGRIVYFGVLPLTILLVPMIARRQALNQPTRPILLMLIGGGAGVCALLVIGAALFGGLIVGLLYGEAYQAAVSLLAPYALAASLYTLTNLALTYQIALGRGGETWMPVLAGLLQIGGIVLFHADLGQVIAVQVALMSVLLGAVLWRVMRV